QGGTVALVVHARAHRRGDRRGRIRRVVVVAVDVGDRVAVGDHVALEAPGAAQVVLEQQVVGAGRLAVDAVVGAHHRTGAAFHDRGAERRQVGVLQVVAGDVDIGRVAGRLGTAVHRVVLGRGDDVVPARVLALHALHV